jgi:transcriptional regulator with XRE-family HTH domain
LRGRPDSRRGRLADSRGLPHLRVEVRATRLKALREARGLTQRRLAHDLGISQNYIPAIEGGARRAGRKLQAQLTKYFKCRFEDLFEIVLVDPATGEERMLQPKA